MFCKKHGIYSSLLSLLLLFQPTKVRAAQQVDGECPGDSLFTHSSSKYRCEYNNPVGEYQHEKVWRDASEEFYFPSKGFGAEADVRLFTSKVVVNHPVVSPVTRGGSRRSFLFLYFFILLVRVPGAMNPP